MPAPEDKFAGVDELLFPVGKENGGITTKYTLDQPTVEAALKERYIKNNPALEGPKTFLQLFLAGLGDVANNVGNFFADLVDGWNAFWDGIFGTTGSTGKTPSDVNAAAAVIASTANTADSNASAALDLGNDIQAAIVDEWFGPGASTGDPAQVASVIAAIKAAL